MKCCSYVQFTLIKTCMLMWCLTKVEAHRLLEAHSRNVTSHGCVLLMAAAKSLLVEETLCDGLLKSRALHLIHMHRTHT